MVQYSIIVPIRNEERFVNEFLMNIESQTLDRSKFEVLLIDGMSTDKTREEITRIKNVLTFELVILSNPNVIVSSALNIGYKNAKGKIIIRLDVHSKFNAFYLERLISSFLIHEECCNLGGRTLATGYDLTSNQIAFALNSPFGVGGAKFRYSREIVESDTVFPGIFNKADLYSIGGWDESWVINEDAELNYRLKKHTGKTIKVIPHEEIQIEYYPRNTFKGFAKQYYNYGLWRNKTNIAHPKSMRISHLVPPMFLLFILLTTPNTFFNFIFLILLVAVLIMYCLIIRLAVGRNISKDLSFFKLLFVFLILHLAWGAGTLVGYAKFGIPFKGIWNALAEPFKAK